MSALYVLPPASDAGPSPLKDLNAQITFQKEKGQVLGMLMDQEGRPQRELKKIK